MIRIRQFSFASGQARCSIRKDLAAELQCFGLALVPFVPMGNYKFASLGNRGMDYSKKGSGNGKGNERGKGDDSEI